MEHWMWKLANQFCSFHVCPMLTSSGVASTFSVYLIISCTRVISKVFVLDILDNNIFQKLYIGKTYILN